MGLCAMVSCGWKATQIHSNTYMNIRIKIMDRQEKRESFYGRDYVTVAHLWGSPPPAAAARRV